MKTKNRLRLKIITIVISIALLPLLFGGLVILNRLQFAQTDQAFKVQNEIAKRAAQSIQNDIDSLFDSFELIPRFEFFDPQQPQNQESLLNQYLKFSPNLLEVSFLDTSGQELVKLSKYEVVTSDNLLNYKNDPRFFSMLEGPRRLFYSFDNQNKIIFTLASHLMDSTGQLRGIILAKVDPNFQQAAQIQVGQSGSLYIVSDKGQVVFHKDPEVNNTHQDFSSFCPVDAFKSHPTNAIYVECRYQNNKGEDVLGTVLPVFYTFSAEKGTEESTMLGVVTELPTKEALAPVTTLQNF